MKMNNNYQPLRIWLLLFLGLLSLPALAQVNISGTVIDETGLGLPGVNVVIKGTATGTATDIDGKYQLSVPSTESILVYSYIGYTSQEITVASQSTIDVQMQLDSETLDEIVVIGYGIQKKTDLTGSVTAIDSKEFNKGAMVSPQDLIVGRTAGVQVTTTGGAPGSGATIRIRGGSSLSASNNPLIVVDGTPLDTEGVAGIGNPLSAINPNDIESMTVLKDASATAIYGSRASNGVIIITTKRGKAGAPLSVSYGANVSVYTVPNTIDVLGAEEFRSLINARAGDASTNLPASATGLLGQDGVATNWQDAILSTAVGTEHNIGVSGSVKSMPYRASLGYSNQNGILATSKYERTSFALGLDPSFLDDQLKVNINAKYSRNKSRFADQGAIGSAVTFDPTKPLRDDNTDFGGYYYWANEGQDANGIFSPISIAPRNPLATLEQRNNQAVVNRFIGNVKFNYTLPFLPDLTASINLGLDRASTDESTIVDQNYAGAYEGALSFEDANGNTVAIPVAQTGGQFYQKNETKSNELFQFTLNYNKSLGKSNLSILGGYEWQHFKTENDTYDNNRLETRPNPITDIFATENYLVSFFGRANYSFGDGRYLLTATIRTDGSSRFIGDNQWGTFPSAAFAWRLKDEAFLKDIDALTQLKVRVGYGVTGQQNLNNGDYPALARILGGNNQVQQQSGDQFFNTSRVQGYNPLLKWEETSTLNFGLDFGFAQDRITGTIDVYQRTTEDLLNVIPVAIGSNNTDKILTNIGSLENNGIEIGLNGIIVDKNDFTVEAGLNFSRNVNEITKLTASASDESLGVFTGPTVQQGKTVQIHSTGSTASSYHVYEQVYGTNGMPIEGTYVDQNGDGLINDDDRIIYNNPNPDYYMGYSLRTTYKQLSFSANARLNVGNHVYNQTAANIGQYNNLYNSAGGGYLNNVAAIVSDAPFNTSQPLSSHYVQDASFFRLDNVTVGYALEDVIAGKYDVFLNFTIQNVFVGTNYKGLDPEIDGGIDNNVYPRPRTFLFSLNVNF